MHKPPYVSIPLYARDGSVRAWAILDHGDVPLLGAHRWHLNRSKNAGQTQGYAVDENEVRMHRVILGLAVGDGKRVDHRNRNTLDNRRLNLRVVTHAENMRNRPSARGSTSCYRGVHWDKRKNRWVGQVKTGGKKVFYKRFHDELEAAEAVYAFLTDLGWPADKPDP